MRLLTTKEAGNQLQVTQKAVLKAIDRGKLLAFKFGRDWQIDQKELDRWNSIRRKRTLKVN